jgi:excisionase family DNA binding protein
MDGVTFHLSDSTRTQRRDNPEDELLTINELKRILKCSQSYAYILVRSGRLPSVRIGKGGKTFIRVRRGDLNLFLREHTVNGR